MVLLWVIIVSLSAAYGVAKLMREIVGILPSFSEVFPAVVSRRPGGDFLFPLVFALCRLEVCLEDRPGFVGAFLIV